MRVKAGVRNSKFRDGEERTRIRLVWGFEFRRDPHLSSNVESEKQQDPPSRNTLMICLGGSSP